LRKFQFFRISSRARSLRIVLRRRSFDLRLLGASGETSRCVLPTNATHYLTNCTRARGFFGSLGSWSQAFTCDSGSSRKDRCVSRRLRSLQRGKPVFANREVFVPDAWFPSLLLLRHPPLRSAPFFSNGCREHERRTEITFAFVPVKETKVAMIRKQVP
jgi:hypothetical protein